MEAYKKNVREVISHLETNIKIGLTEEEAKKRVSIHGANILKNSSKEGFFSVFLDNIVEPIPLILIITAFVSIVMDHLIDGVSILSFVTIALIFKTILRYRWEKVFEANLKGIADSEVQVIRNGVFKFIPKNGITIGDILFIEKGSKVPADGRIISAQDLKLDEKIITNVKEFIQKSNECFSDDFLPVSKRKNMVFANTNVVEGRGIIVVTDISHNTEFGKQFEELGEEVEKDSVFQTLLKKILRKTTVFTTSLAFAIFLLQMLKVLIGSGYVGSIELFEQIKNSLVFCTAIIMASSHEYISFKYLAAASISLPSIIKEKVIIKELSACEKLCDIDVICTNKNGTITKKSMEVSDVWSDGVYVELNEIKSIELLENFCINGTAQLFYENDSCQQVGSNLECSLIYCAQKNNINFNDIRDLHPKIMSEFEFKDEKKLMTTAIEHNVGYRIFSKGTIQNILEICDRVLYSGKIVNFTEECKLEILIKVEEMQNQGKSVMAFSYKDENQYQLWHVREEIEKNMIFQGFVALENEIRLDVLDSVQNCKKSGIDVKIISGDNINTTKYIANKLGLMEKDSIVLCESEIADVHHNIKAISESCQKTKLHVLRYLMQKGQSVIFIGGNSEDVIPIKEATVGVGLNIAGTEAAKAAADIVLLDDSFSGTVKAIGWAREVLFKYKKALLFHLTVIISLILTSVMSEILPYSIRFTTNQILWMCIIMYSPLSFALLYGNMGDLYKYKKQRKSKEFYKDIIGNVLISSIIILTGMTILIILNGEFKEEAIIWGTLPIQRFVPIGRSLEESNSIFFAVFCFYMIWSLFNSTEFGSRSVLRNIFSKKKIITYIIIAFIIQYLISEFGFIIFKTIYMDWKMWIRILLYSSSVILISEIVKFFWFSFKLCTNKSK